MASKILLFNGALERRNNGTSRNILSYFHQRLQWEGMDVSVFDLADAGIPFFDVTLQHTPIAAQVMARAFRSADMHIWLTPLYHGGMTGAMKNCLDPALQHPGGQGPAVRRCPRHYRGIPKKV